MAVLRYSLKAAYRRKGKSLIVIAVSLILVLFFTMYSRAITKHRDTLAELHDSIEVTGQITNHNGSASDDLSIREGIIRELEASDFIGEYFYTRNLLLLTEPLPQSDFEQQQRLLNNAGTLVGANTIAAISEFSSPADIQPDYLAGYDKNLFSSKEKVCIISGDLLNSLNLQLGDTYQFFVAENANIARVNLPHAELTLKIVGVYSGPVHMKAYCPWHTVTTAYQRLGIYPTWSSARFYLRNTLRLDEFRSLLSKLNFIDPQSGIVAPDRLGFIINDRILSNVTSSVNGYIKFMTALYPVIYLLTAGIGFIVSYMLIRLRKPEFAIMRSLGTSGARTFLGFFWEQIFLSFLGTVVGLLLTLAMTRTITASQAASVAGYLLFYLLGATIALTVMSRTNVIQILTAKE